MRKRLWQLLTACMVAALFAPLVQLGAASADGQGLTFDEYAIPMPAEGLTAGSDGNLWYANHSGMFDHLTNTVCTTTASGSTATPCETVSDPGLAGGAIGYSITGPNGNIWFTTNRGFQSVIGEMNTSGAIVAAYTVPAGGNLVIGSDGNLWFVSSIDNGDGTITPAIGRITMAGVVTEFPVDTPALSVGSITSGPDGDLWFTDSVSNPDGSFTNQIGRITTSGDITWFPGTSGSYSYDSIVAGPDGNLWLAEVLSPETGGPVQIARMTPSGEFTQFSSLSAQFTVDGNLVSGPGNSVWFTEEDDSLGSTTSKLVRVAMDGVVTEYSPPDDVSSMGSAVIGPDGNLWIPSSENSGSQLLQVLLPNSPTGLTAATPTNQHPSLSWTAPADGSATSYNVYRNGSLIGSTTDTDYVDTTATQGSYNYRVTAVNTSGQESLPSNTINVVYTTTGPTIHVTAPAANSAVSGTVTVSGTITEPDQIQNSQVVVHLRAVKSDGKLDGFLNTLYAPVNSDGTWSVTFDGTAFPDGQYGVTALATDIAGNSQTAVGGASVKPFTIDNTKPTVGFTAPTSFLSSYTVGPTVAISAADSGSGLAVMAIHVYTSSNQLLTVCGSATPTELAAGSMSCDLSGLAPGTYYIKAGATDKAGKNTTIVSPAFTITG